MNFPIDALVRVSADQVEPGGLWWYGGIWNLIVLATKPKAEQKFKIPLHGTSGEGAGSMREVRASTVGYALAPGYGFRAVVDGVASASKETLFYGALVVGSTGPFIPALWSFGNEAHYFDLSGKELKDPLGGDLPEFEPRFSSWAGMLVHEDRPTGTILELFRFRDPNSAA